MAANFKVSVSKKSSCFHLKLHGYFDGSSAYELLHLILKLCNAKAKVYVHTEHLKAIYPFGRNVFQNNLHLIKAKEIRLMLTGENARRMLPDFVGNHDCVQLAVS